MRQAGPAEACSAGATGPRTFPAPGCPDRACWPWSEAADSAARARAAAVAAWSSDLASHTDSERNRPAPAVQAERASEETLACQSSRMRTMRKPREGKQSGRDLPGLAAG